MRPVAMQTAMMRHCALGGSSSHCPPMQTNEEESRIDGIDLLWNPCIDMSAVWSGMSLPRRSCEGYGPYKTAFGGFEFRASEAKFEERMSEIIER